MVFTPLSLLIEGITKLLAEPELNGALVEIHSEGVLVRDAPYQYSCDATRHNIERSWEMFKAARFPNESK